MKWCAPRSWWSAIWIPISLLLSWPDTCAVWVIREPGRHKGSCILISTVAYLILIRILQLGHCHCFSSTVKSRETYETEMIPWRRRLIESSPYHWCALIHPIKIFNLLSPILKGWAGKGSCQEALLPLSIRLSFSVVLPLQFCASVHGRTSLQKCFFLSSPGLILINHSNPAQAVSIPRVCLCTFAAWLSRGNQITD